jgi:hypothetical protein
VPPLDRPEVRDFVVDLELVVDLDRVGEPELVFEPLALDVEPVLRDRDVGVLLERPREPDVRDDVPPSPPPSSVSSSEPSSFFPTPTAAAVARPTAAPVATFFGVDIPSLPSSSDAMVTPPSVPR